jgi:NADH-ubiquinone oxidoreductase chain 3
MNITPLLLLFIIVPILAVALLALNVLLAVHQPDESKVSAYECGFKPIVGQTRSTFQVHFFIVALLFLIFDLEILLIFPVAVTLYQVSLFGFSVAFIFFFVLTIGFVLEIGSGAISLENVNFKTPKYPFSLPSNLNTYRVLQGKATIKTSTQKRYFSTSCYKFNFQEVTNIQENLVENSEFLLGLAGFTYAEGSFGFSLNNTNTHVPLFRFRIHLHSNEIEA